MPEARAWWCVGNTQQLLPGSHSNCSCHHHTFSHISLSMLGDFHKSCHLFDGVALFFQVRTYV